MIIKKSLSVKSGFIRINKKYEINWMLDSWSIPLSIWYTKYLWSISILCFTFIFFKK